jgi:hypothetical protein
MSERKTDNPSVKGEASTSKEEISNIPRKVETPTLREKDVYDVLAIEYLIEETKAKELLLSSFYEMELQALRSGQRGTVNRLSEIIFNIKKGNFELGLFDYKDYRYAIYLTVDGEDLSQCVSGYNEYTGEFKPDEDFYFL